MNIDIYCKAVSVTTDLNNEVKVFMIEIDKSSLLEEITDKFTLAEIIKMYDDEFVTEVLKCE